MRSSTAQFGTEIGQSENEPVAVISIAWPAGIAGPAISVDAVESVEVAASYTTDMPEGTKLITGYPARSATVILSGIVGTDETQTAAWLFDPYSTTSPLYGLEWTGPDGAVISYSQGLRLIGVAAPETFGQFVGYVDKMDLNRAAGSVTLTLIDSRSVLRNVPSLPLVISGDSTATLPTGVTSGDINPGLTGLWFVNYLLQANNINTVPALTSACGWAMSGHGSIWPETCRAVTRARFKPADLEVPDAGWVPGQFAGQVPNSSEFAGTPAGSGFPEAVGGGVMFEFWIKTDTTARTDPCSVSAGNVSLDLRHNAATGQITVTGLHVFRNTVLTNIALASPSSPAGFGWHQVNVAVSWPTATTARARVYFEGNPAPAKDVTVAGLANVAAEDTTTKAAWAATSGTFNLPVEGLRILRGAGLLPTPAGWTAQADLDASLNNLTATPSYDAADAWSLLQQLAAAEYAVAGFEQNRFFYRNRYNRPAASQTTVTAQTSIKGLGLGLAESTRARSVTATVHPLIAQPLGPVWSPSDMITVPAKGQKVVIAALSPPALFIPRNSAFYPTGGPVPPYVSGGQTVNWYQAYNRRDYGHAASLIIIVTMITASTAKVDIRNPHAFDVAIIDPSSGQPALYLIGQAIGTASRNPAGDANSDGSITVTSTVGTGLPALQLPDTPWRQDQSATQLLLDDMLADLHRPRPMFTELTIVGDPRLQLGDRVRLQDPGLTVNNGAGVPIDEDVLLTSIGSSYSRANGYTQTLACRAVASPQQWILGQAGRSELGSTTWI